MNSLVEHGIFEIELGKSYHILVEVEDLSGNKSIIETYIEGKKNTIKQVLGVTMFGPSFGIGQYERSGRFWLRF